MYQVFQQLLPAWLVVTLMLQGTVVSNPVDFMMTQLQTAQCGERVEVRISIDDVITFSSSYLTTEGVLPANCVIYWRIALMDPPIFENWGLSGSGTVDLPNTNDTQCSDSSVTVTDEDQEGDVSAITKKYCGQNTISYLTYEDSVTVILRTSDDGAVGLGFDELTIKPVKGCGGVVSGSIGDSALVATPDFPTTYPSELSCTWNVKIPEEASADLYCDDFNVKPQVNGRCVEELMVVTRVGVDHYCGRQLHKKTLTFSETNRAALFFRSGRKSNKYLGFNCTLTYNSRN